MVRGCRRSSRLAASRLRSRTRWNPGDRHRFVVHDSRLALPDVAARHLRDDGSIARRVSPLREQGLVEADGERHKVIVRVEKSKRALENSGPPLMKNVIGDHDAARGERLGSCGHVMSNDLGRVTAVNAKQAHGATHQSPSARPRRASLNRRERSSPRRHHRHVWRDFGAMTASSPSPDRKTFAAWSSKRSRATVCSPDSRNRWRPISSRPWCTPISAMPPVTPRRTCSWLSAAISERVPGTTQPSTRRLPTREYRVNPGCMLAPNSDGYGGIDSTTGRLLTPVCPG